MTLDSTGPRISVIVPTYARPEALASCLESLAALDEPPGGFEVVVVDDGGPTPLDAVLAPFAERLRIVHVHQANAGPAAARNAGAEAASGRFLAFTDDDCRPDPRWLCALDACFASNRDVMAGGCTVNRLDGNVYAAASQLILDLVYDFYNEQPAHARFFASQNMAVPAERFEALGGFDERFATAEDRELCDRWRHRGGQLVYVPDAVIEHGNPLSLARFCRQHFRYGQGAYRYHRVRSGRRSGRLTQDMRFHARLPGLLRRRLAGAGLGRTLGVCALLGVWQVANAAGFFWEGIARRSSHGASRSAVRSGTIAGSVRDG